MTGWPRLAEMPTFDAGRDEWPCNGWARGASKGAMKRLIAMCAIALIVPAFAVACGGGQPEVNQPSNPPATSSSSSEAASGQPASSAPSASSAAAAESAAPAPSAAASTSASSEAAGRPGPGDWEKWTHDQKLAYMKSTVMPKMGALFHDFDAKAYAETKCVLCHGAGVKDGSFKMPNPDLPKLELTPAGMKAMHAKHPKAVDFMMKQVEPTMAELLGESPYDPKTGQGFGCLGCHTKKK